MPRNKIVILAALFLLLMGCIEPFEIEDAGLGEPKIVIRGEIKSQEGFQYVYISQSSNPSNPEFIGVSFCDVYMFDNANSRYQFEETEPGIYRVWMDSAQLITGKSFKLRVYNLNTNSEYESEWDSILPSADLPDVYGIRKDEEQSSGAIENGVQFYLNFKGNISDSRFYRYEINETYEYQTPFPIDFVYEGGIKRSEIGTKYQVCYRNKILTEIFTLSTAGLASNDYPRFPLQYTNEKSEKLNHRYSILVTQFAMSSASFAYWKAIQENSQQSGSLYNKQPLSIKGNMRNVNDPKEKVLGHFSVTAMNQRRFFFTPNEFDLEGHNKYACVPFVDPDIGMVPPSAWPLYMVESQGQIMRADHVCFDCRLSGGTIEKPEFW